MLETIASNYFYGDEAMQFTYFRIPSQPITSPRYKHLSTDSKLLYFITFSGVEEYFVNSPISARDRCGNSGNGASGGDQHSEQEYLSA